ncbi:iron ABC transporter permease [Psittacicella melopsittaci]|uniref:Iron ABC transporter permease n=1 Tax=Psittacicella melopsittaci TaxID=2028576 RepID=A0A3A1Y8R3_9GAMM|nr:iron chelate uptake ABC transporter family permease subunit [Psittacicella melopsittaci]RIY33706.1 iron ABC transporter permease [Psittacicella melopsittaci]
MLLQNKLLILLLVLLSAGSLFLGVSSVSLSGLWQLNSEEWEVFTISRIPRLISILITGSGLAICGLIMQQIAQNKFVSPTTAGTISCAKLGILISIVIFPTAGLLLKAGFAITVAFIGSLIFMKLLRSLKFTDIILVPLVGIMFGKIIDAFTEFFAYKYDLLQSFAAWLQGDFALVIGGRYEILFLSVPCLILAYLYAHKFAIAGMGESNATSLGINFKQVMFLGIVLVSVVTAIIVVTAGSIPFVGLIVPNIVSLIYGDNLRKTLPLNALWGAIFVLICDIIARAVIYPFEVSISSVVGTIGSIVFIYLIYRRFRHGK